MVSQSRAALAREVTPLGDAADVADNAHDKLYADQPSGDGQGVGHDALAKRPIWGLLLCFVVGVVHRPETKLTLR